MRSDLSHLWILAIVVLAIVCLAPVPALALPPPGGIQVYSSPSNAYACVDGSCQDTPATFPLAPGRYYTLAVSKNGYRTYTEDVFVASQVTTVVNANLRPVPTGSMQVYSTPSGATACVDGGYCLSTPATFDGLSGDNYHTLTVASSGYQTYYDNVMITGDQTSVVEAILTQPRPATGRIQVFITPGGGTVCLDGGQCQVDVGTASATGSCQFGDIAANMFHTITVTERGYQPVSTEIYVKPDETNEASIVLTPISEPSGNIQVSVAPGGGTVCLDGARCDASVGAPGGTGSTQFTTVPAGAWHTIAVTLPGYQPYSSQVYVNTGETAQVTANLKQNSPQPAPTRSPMLPFAAPAAIAICCAAILLWMRR